MAREKSNSLLIRGGRVIDPAAKIDATMDVLLRDGRVAEITPPNKISVADEKFNARGLIVASGFTVTDEEDGRKDACVDTGRFKSTGYTRGGTARFST